MHTWVLVAGIGLVLSYGTYNDNNNDNNSSNNNSNNNNDNNNDDNI